MGFVGRRYSASSSRLGNWEEWEYLAGWSDESVGVRKYSAGSSASDS